VRKEHRVTIDEVRRDLVVVDLGLLGIGEEDHHEIRLSGGIGDGEHAKPGSLGLGTRRGALPEADADIYPRVAQIEGVRVPLRSVSEYRDLPVGDETAIRVVRVEELRHVG
jgi:hypothetical protein